MRKALAVVLTVVGITLLPATLFAQETNWDGQYHKGDLSFELGVGFGAHGSGFGYGLAVLPGAEWTVADWKIGEAVPLAVGVAATGFVELIPGTGLGLEADALLAFHSGFKGLDAPKFFQNLDVYTAIGAGVVFVGEASVPFGLVFPTIHGGFAWYFKENLAVYLEGVYRHGWRAVGYGGGAIGIRLKRMITKEGA